VAAVFPLLLIFLSSFYWSNHNATRGPISEAERRERPSLARLVACRGWPGKAPWACGNYTFRCLNLRERHQGLCPAFFSPCTLFIAVPSTLMNYGEKSGYTKFIKWLNYGENLM
jgi:hypothetical protein